MYKGAVFMHLDLTKDYGFTVAVDHTTDLPVWDSFRLARIGEIFRTCRTIIDFGDSSRALASLFEDDLVDKQRISLDINPLFQPHIAADICHLPLPKERIDGIICAAMLEHVYNPFLAMAELYRVLATGGKLFIYVPWMFNYHASDQYQDYYRFSRDGIRYLLQGFSQIELCPVRGRVETILNLIPRFGKRSRFIHWFGGLIRKIDHLSERHTSGFNVYAIK